MSKNYPSIKDEILAGLERRKHLIRAKCVPFEHEIVKVHGDCFGNILLNQMTPNAITLMHQDKEHKMPNSNLWVSPESRVNKKVCITNASFYDQIKAISHKGILDIGEGIEKKLRKKHSFDLQKAVNNNTEFERFECEKRMQFALQSQQKYYKQKIKKLIEKFNEKFKYQKDVLQNHYQKKCNKIVQKIISDCSNTIADASVIAKNKTISCFCAPRSKKKKMKKRCKTVFTSTTNLKIPETPKYLQQNYLFNNKSLCNMMHFVLCGQRLEHLNLMKNIEKRYANELNNLQVNLFNIVENITNDINQPPFTPQRICKTGKSIKYIKENDIKETETNYTECFDILCCLRKKLNNVLLCLDNRMKSLNFDVKNNILNTCTVIVPHKYAKQKFCDCVSSSLDSSTKSSSSNAFDFQDFTSPNVDWYHDIVENRKKTVVCKCQKNIDILDTSSSSERSFVRPELPEYNNVELPQINTSRTCSSTSSY